MRRHFALATGLLVALAIPAVRARSQPPPAQVVVPPARAELVELDAVVTDERGQPVRDLAESDFEVLEDGKAQKVSQFFFVTRARARPAAASTPPPSQAGVVVEAPSVAPTPEPETSLPGRYVVIVVDDLHIGLQSMVGAKQALRRFVDDVAAPDDQIAILTTTGMAAIQQPTRDRATVGQAIERLVTREPSSASMRSARLTPEQAELILRGDRSAMQLAIATVITEPGTLINPNSPQVAAEGPGSAARDAAGGGAGASQDAGGKGAQREGGREGGPGPKQAA